MGIFVRYFDICRSVDPHKRRTTQAVSNVTVLGWLLTLMVQCVGILYIWRGEPLDTNRWTIPRIGVIFIDNEGLSQVWVAFCISFGNGLAMAPKLLHKCGEWGCHQNNTLQM